MTLAQEMMMKIAIMIMLCACCGACQTRHPTKAQTDLAASLSEMIAARNKMAFYYKDGDRALRALLADRNQWAKLTFKTGVDWSRLTEEELHACLIEVKTEIRLVQADLTISDGLMLRQKSANQAMQADGAAAPRPDR